VERGRVRIFGSPEEFNDSKTCFCKGKREDKEREKRRTRSPIPVDGETLAERTEKKIPLLALGEANTPQRLPCKKKKEGERKGGGKRDDSKRVLL